MSEFVKAEEKQGKKYTQVATMIGTLRKAKAPVPFKTLCLEAEVKYEQDVQAAMFALELAGIVDRYNYVEEGSSRKQVAYALNAEAGSVPPSRGASSASTRSSKKQSAKKAPAKKAAAKSSAKAAR